MTATQGAEASYGTKLGTAAVAKCANSFGLFARSSPNTTQKKERRGHPRRPQALGQRPYAHFGSPSLLAGASWVEPTYTAHVLVVVVCDTVAVKPSAVTVMVGPTTPLVVLYAEIGRASCREG